MSAEPPVRQLWRMLREDPRRALGKAQRALDVARAQVLFRSCQKGRGVAASGRVQLEGGARVTLGSRVTFLGGMIPTRVCCGPDGHVEIGDDTVLNYGALISAEASVRIGRRCMLASLVRLEDHGPSGVRPIVLGDDVWIAHGAILEPGVSIGEGSVVAAGAVVTKDVPPRSMAIGNPARVVALELVARE